MVSATNKGLEETRAIEGDFLAFISKARDRRGKGRTIEDEGAYRAYYRRIEVARHRRLCHSIVHQSAVILFSR